MQKAVQRFFFIFTKNKFPRKSRAQSLVEVAIAFPVLLMIFGGVVEFGFIMNNYLSLLDATREAARYWSGDDPFLSNGADDLTFYENTAKLVRTTLDPGIKSDGTTNPDYKGRRIVLNPATDDVIVSVYSACGTDIDLHPTAGPYHFFPTPGHTTGNYQSIFTEESIEGGHLGTAPNAGILVVEVHHNFDQILSLPWVTMFLPDPLYMRAYTIMPIIAGEGPCP